MVKSFLCVSHSALVATLLFEGFLSPVTLYYHIPHLKSIVFSKKNFYLLDVIRLITSVYDTEKRSRFHYFRRRVGAWFYAEPACYRPCLKVWRPDRNRTAPRGCPESCQRSPCVLNTGAPYCPPSLSMVILYHRTPQMSTPFYRHI